MDDLQKRRISHEIAGMSFPVPSHSNGVAEIRRILSSLGISGDVLESGRCALPFMLIGSATGALAEHGAGEQNIVDCLGGLENTHSFAPYWLEIKHPEGIENVAIIDQCARIMRVGYNEIWEIFLDLDETFEPSECSTDPSGEAKVDAARKKAMAVCRFLISVTWQALPKHLLPSPDDAVTPPPAGA